MEKSFIEIVKEQMVGKKLRHKNRYGRMVVLEIEDIKTEHHNRQITPDTPENDWWGETKNWTTNKILFVDGSSIDFDEGIKFEIVE